MTPGLEVLKMAANRIKMMPFEEQRRREGWVEKGDSLGEDYILMILMILMILIMSIKTGVSGTCTVEYTVDVHP